MVAAATPFGLRPVNHISANLVRPFWLKLTKALMEATPTLFQYQPVALDTSGRLAAAANGSSFCGVFEGVEYTDLASGRPVVANNWVTGTTVKNLGADSARVYFSVDQGIMYEVQANAALTAAAEGDQLDFANIGVGNSTTGLSQAVADTATLKGAGVQGMLRIMNLALEPDNLDWTDAFPNIFVMIARHQFVANVVAI